MVSQMSTDTRACYETLKAGYFDLESGQLIYLHLRIL